MLILKRNCVRQFVHEKGTVSLYCGDNFYYFVIEKQLGPGHTFIRERGRLDFISANDFFDVACRYIRDEIEWVEPVRKFSCKYNLNRARGCTDVNCPRVLGGVDYRYVFGATCPYRKTSRTR